jgi:hypothetical protein
MGRLPLCYATATALRQAAQLLPPGSILENRCEQEISAGNCVHGRDGGLVFDSSQK